MKEDELLQLLGSNMRKLRTSKGISQYSLALKTGMAPNSINDIENGKRWVSAKSLSKIADALEVEPYIFLLPQTLQTNETSNFIKMYHEDVYKTILSAIDGLRQKYNID